MKIPAWLIGVVMVAIVMGVWYFRAGRHGGGAGYVDHKLGLMEGEAIEASFSGYYHYEPGAGDVIRAMGGVVRRGQHLIVALTSRDRLLLGHNESSEPPVQLTREAVAAVRTVDGASTDVRRIGGPGGELEDGIVVEIELRDGTVLPLDLPVSGVRLIGEWAQR